MHPNLLELCRNLGILTCSAASISDGELAKKIVGLAKIESAPNEDFPGSAKLFSIWLIEASF